MVDDAPGPGEEDEVGSRAEDAACIRGEGGRMVGLRGRREGEEVRDGPA